MFRPKKKRMSADISSASLGDMAFIMLFFFISTTKFDVKKGLGIILPAPSTQQTQKARIIDENLTRININDQGLIEMDGEIVTMIQLEGIARAKVRNNPEMVFMLKSSRFAHYNNMVETLDRLRVAGAERINLSTN